MAALRVGERGEGDETAHLRGIVVLDRSLEMLALGCGLAQLPAEPAKETHRGLVRHPEQAIAARD